MTAQAFTNYFTRASAGWYFNSAGVLVQAAANEPRYDYDPLTLAIRGLLVEEQRTNLSIYSNDPSSAAWSTASGMIVTPNAIMAPDGTGAAATITNTPGQTSRLNSPTVSLAFSTTYTRSIFVKPMTTNMKFVMEYNLGGASSYLMFDLATSSITGPGASGGKITQVAGGWYRLSHVFTTDASGTPLARVHYIGQYGSVAETVTFGVWGNQVEQGTFPTSYIPTAAAQVSRSADYASLGLGTAWWNTPEGTLFFDGDCFGANGIHTLVSANSGNSSNRIEIRRAAGQGNIRVAGGAAEVDQSGGSLSTSQRFKAAISFKAGAQITSYSGITGPAGASASLPSVSRLEIGASTAGSFLNGHIGNVLYFPSAYTQAELNTLTL